MSVVSKFCGRPKQHSSIFTSVEEVLKLGSKKNTLKNLDESDPFTTLRKTKNWARKRMMVWWISEFAANYLWGFWDTKGSFPFVQVVYSKLQDAPTLTTCKMQEAKNVAGLFGFDLPTSSNKRLRNK